MWQLGTINIESAYTGSIYMGSNIVQQIYHGQTQVYPDSSFPFPLGSVYDYWIADSGSVGTINSKNLKATGPIGILGPSAKINNHYYYNLGGIGSQLYVDDTQGLNMNTNNLFVIAGGFLSSGDGALDGYKTEFTPSSGFTGTSLLKINKIDPTFNNFCYQQANGIEACSPANYFGSNEPGFLMNTLESIGGRIYRQVYVNSSTPYYAAGDPTYVKPSITRVVIATSPYNTFRFWLAEIVILTAQPTQTMLDIYRAHLSSTYNVTA